MKHDLSVPPRDRFQQIELVHRARAMLAEVQSLDEIKDIVDMTEAIWLQFKRQGVSLDVRNMVAEIKLWAERRGGELLLERNRRDDDGGS